MANVGEFATPSVSAGAPTSVIPQKRYPDGVLRRQQSKVTRACDICKAKKAKCSGEQPCRTCNRRGLECRYNAVYARGKAPAPRRVTRNAFFVDVTPSTPGRTTESADITDSRTIHNSTTGEGTDTSSHLSNGGLNDTENDTTRAGLTDLDLLAAMATRSLDPISEAPSRASPGLEVAGQYSDTTSGLSFLHRAWRRISNGENCQIMGGHLSFNEEHQVLVRAGDKPFQIPGIFQLPPLDRGYQLLGLYFDVCIATYRLLHRPTVESWFNTISDNFTSSQPLSASIGLARTSIVLSVLAVAYIHEERARGESGLSPDTPNAVPAQSDEMFCEALRLTDIETGFPKLESAQARLIQVLYLLMSSRFNQAWYVFGHALQVLSALGLHRREDRKRSSLAHRRDYIEEQCKKRTFWVAYTLDKYLGVMFGRPRHYHDDDIDQDFPDAVNDEDMTPAGPRDSDNDRHIESLIAHAKLAQIAEKISREVYSIKVVPDEERLAAAHRLGAQLRQWKKSLPPFLGAINPSSLIPSFRRQAMALRMSHSHAVMLAHRPFLLKNTARQSEESRQLARESIMECIKAAQSVLETVDRITREGRMFHAFWWTHYVCFCALVVVYVWTIQESNNDPTVTERRKILDQAERCLCHLAQATATNSQSRKYSIILQELRAEAKKKAARALHDPMQMPSSTVDRSEARHGQFGPWDGQSIDDMAVTQPWQPLFDSPIESPTPTLEDFLDDWQTTDWLDLDSSAFAFHPVYNESSMTWTGES
jgi:hypothetical protein